MYNNADTFNSTNPMIQNSFLGSKYLNPDYLFNQGGHFLSYVFNSHTLNVIYIILSVLVTFFIAIIVYTTLRMFEIRRKEHAHLHHEIAEYAHNQALKQEESAEKGTFKNERWKKVLDYLFSVNENDWKLAVIEADSMLDDLLISLGFKGDSLGDRLKEANQANFRNINFAWEVHNIRNKIAHEGSSFELSLHEAKRVIALYEQIFQDFGYI